MNINFNRLIIILLIMIGIIVVLQFFYKNNEYENFTATGVLSNEALQNLASVYNAHKLSVTNLLLNDSATITNNLSIGKDLSVGGNSKLSGDLSLGGSSTIGKDLSVTGNSTLSGTVGIGKDTTIGGNATVSGNITGKQLNVTDITGTTINVPNYIPGAYIIGDAGVLPLISSIANYGSINDKTGYILMPGYKLVAYQIEQNTNNSTKFTKGTIQNKNGMDKDSIPNINTLTCDNIDGKSPMFCSSNLVLPNYRPHKYNSDRDNQNFSGTGRSCQLYHKSNIDIPLPAYSSNKCSVTGGNSEKNSAPNGIDGKCVAGK